MGTNLTIPDGFPFGGHQLEEVIPPDELQNRVFDNDEAYWRMCLVCASKWEKQGSEWVISRPPDEYSMREVIGTL